MDLSSYSELGTISLQENTDNMLKKLFLPFWILSSLFLLLYSYTQVDLSLTLSRASIYQSVEKGFQYVGWFNRPLSTYLYIAVFAVMFVLYFWTIKMVSRKTLPRRIIWITILVVAVILFVSYNAFSYDLFNYIFDAKIITHYHQNPYLHKALDFSGDPMLSFMHWTHRIYPYGPIWLIVTVPLTFIANNIFIITFFLFKLLMAAFFLLTVWSIEKIGKVLKFSNILLPVVAFAFNPFILNESLVSSHNDIVMMGLAMYGTYLLLKQERVKGSILYFLSAGIKFATAIVLIGFFILMGLKKTKYFIGLSIVLMIGAVIVASMRTNFQPWYLLYVAPFAVLMFEKSYVKFPIYIFSIASIVYYIPFLYNGNWNPPIPMLLNDIMIGATIISVIFAFVFYPLAKKEKN